MLCQITKFEIDDIIRLDDGDRFRDRHPAINPDSLLGYSVVDCSLTEELLKPNEFEFTLRRDNLEKSSYTKSYEVIGGLIGKNVACDLTVGLSVFQIRGKIAKVSMKGLSITCVAYGDDAQLQGHPKCRCFYGKTLSQIVMEVLNPYQEIRNKIIDIHSAFDGLNLPYVVQYNENDYDFLARLAKRFGAFFFYHIDQKTLYFGKIPDQNIFDLTTTQKVSSVSYELEAADPNFRHVACHDAMGAIIGSEEPDINAFAKSSLMERVVAGSERRVVNSALFIDDPNCLPNDPTVDYLKNYSTSVASSMLGNQTTCKFMCYHHKVHVGDIVKVDGNGPVLVTSAHLTWDADGAFQSENTAMLLLGDDRTPIAYDTIFAPYMDINAYPKSSAQRAIVVDNLDPLKMGRVMVRFAWQDVGQANYAVPADDTDEHFKARKQYPWVRIAQPYAGNNKGCFILPEIGEEVMVGFENDNMERPFVIGSLFHDSATAAEKQMPDSAWVETRGKSVPQGQNPANKGNEVKAFRTKKGHTIEFHDVDGNSKYGFIRIYGNEKKDGPNYDIVLSTDPIKTGQNKDQSYSITSASTEKDQGFDDYEVGELRIMVRSNGGDIVLDAGSGDIILNAANIRLHTTGDRTAYIEGDDIVKVKHEQDIMVNLSNINVDDSRYVCIKDEDSLQSNKLKFDIKEDVHLTANSLSSETEGKTGIKASDIDAEAQKKAVIKAKSGLELDGGSDAELKAANVKVEAQASITAEAKASATLKGANATVEGTAASSLKTGENSINITPLIGGRSGNWGDN